MQRRFKFTFAAALLTMAASTQSSAQTAETPQARSAHQGRSVGYETWHGYRRWSYGNFGTCNNVQLAAGTCPPYYRR